MIAPPAEDVLFFLSNSPTDKPGSGHHEQVRDPEEYASLPPNFRSMLSNFWVSPFSVEAEQLPAQCHRTFPRRSRWNTVEHLFQACKIALANPAEASLFSLDSGTNMSKAGGIAARMRRKVVELTKPQLYVWNGIQNQVMLTGLRAKFTQHPDLGEMLYNTKQAVLTHSIERNTPFSVDRCRQHLLESIRAELQVNQQRLDELRLLHAESQQLDKTETPQGYAIEPNTTEKVEQPKAELV